MKFAASLAIAAAAVVVGVTRFGAVRQAGGRHQVPPERLFVMAQHFGRIGAMVNGRAPYDAKAAVDNAEIVAEMAKLPWAGFGPGTDKGGDHPGQGGNLDRTGQVQGAQRKAGGRNRQAARRRQDQQPGHPEDGVSRPPPAPARAATTATARTESRAMKQEPPHAGLLPCVTLRLRRTPAGCGVNSAGALIIGSWPVLSSTTRAPPPDCQAPSQKRLSAQRGRIASMVAERRLRAVDEGARDRRDALRIEVQRRLVGVARMRRLAALDPFVVFAPSRPKTAGSGGGKLKSGDACAAARRASRVALEWVLLQLSPGLGTTASTYTRCRSRSGMRSATAVPIIPAYECTASTTSSISSISMASMTSVMCVSSVIAGDIRWARSPAPVKVTAWARCPRCIRLRTTWRQHQPPCQAPCTRTKLAIQITLLLSQFGQPIVGAIEQLAQHFARCAGPASAAAGRARTGVALSLIGLDTSRRSGCSGCCHSVTMPRCAAPAGRRRPRPGC